MSVHFTDKTESVSISIRYSKRGDAQPQNLAEPQNLETIYLYIVVISIQRRMS